jgi:DNA-directed RNA polymerase subunit beta'
MNILDTLPADNQYLDDFDPNKFVAKMGRVYHGFIGKN